MIEDTYRAGVQISEAQTVLIQTSDEWCVVHFVAGVLIGSVGVFVSIEQGISFPPQDHDEVIAVMMAGFFALLLTISVVHSTYHWMWPVAYATTVTPSHITFWIPRTSEVVRVVPRDVVVRIDRASPPKTGYRAEDLFTYKFHLSDGTEYVVDHRFVSAGNKSDLGEAILRHWGVALYRLPVLL